VSPDAAGTAAEPRATRVGGTPLAPPRAWRTVTTVAGLTLKEAARKRVVWALLALSCLLLGLSAWGFSQLTGMDTSYGQLTSAMSRVIASQLLNLVMFGMSMVVALGTAFLAGPTLGGEIESGVSLAMFARPVRRWHVLLGKWLGLVVFGCAYMTVVGLSQFVVVHVTVSYWPPHPWEALLLLGGETTVLLTLAMLLSSLISPLASGITTVGLFGATWVAGVVGSIGIALDNDKLQRIATVAQVLLPTDGLWQGAMHAIQDTQSLLLLGQDMRGSPFLSAGAPSAVYLLWAVVWTVLVWLLCALLVQRRDL
jgi:ABC-type transport system involved in multi-copper enzyme maturation permease subunit